MKTTIKRKWTKALRNGKIKQAEGALKTPEGAMCCLGVLAHVGGATKWVNPPRGIRKGDWLMPMRGRSRLYSLTYDNNPEAYLSNTFLREVGFDREAMRTLAHMNDDGKSFDEIADYIDVNL